MSEFAVLRELLILLAVIIPIVFSCQKLRVPAVVGFLIAGMIMGPDGLGLIRNGEQVETLASIGIVLLLFEIGLEFSLRQFISTSRAIVTAGIAQIALTVLVVSAIAVFLGHRLEVGIFYGFLVSLSSTAIVLKVYRDRGEIDAPHGRLATGILLFQDLCLVPMMLLLPVLGQSGKVSFSVIGWALGKALLALALIALAARMALPWLLHHVALLRNRELFTLFVVFVCLGTAWLTWESGLSLALGAFIAGLVISDSEFSGQIVAEILPLRDLFSGIFFTSVGMLVSPVGLARDLPGAVLSLALMVGIKGSVVFLIFWWLYGSLRLGLILALGLAQIGEFSFILAEAGRGYGFLPEAARQTFLTVSILGMIATPFLIRAVHGAAYGLDELAGMGAVAEKGGEADSVAGHVVIVGYGLNGRNLSRVLREVGIPYRVLDMNPGAVQRARGAGEPVFFGDGTRPEILRKAGIERARALVVAISDPVATVRIVSLARRLRPDLYTIVRTRYVAEIDRLYRLGADQVIPEEFETSVEIFARVLEEFRIPRNVISLQVDLIRKEHYGTLRGLRLEGKRLDELSKFLAGTTTDTFMVMEGSPAVGKTLDEIELRKRSGVTVIAAVRNGQSLLNPGADFRVEAGDVLVLVGSHKALDEAMQLLSPPG